MKIPLGAASLRFAQCCPSQGSRPEEGREHSQEVMEVEKTVSPQMDLVLPKLVPWKDWPDLRWRVAGIF